MIAKRILRRVIKLIADDYWNGWLYVFDEAQAAMPVDSLCCAAINELASVANSPYPELHLQAWLPEADSWPFGAWVGPDLAAITWFQTGETYKRHGGLLHLDPDEAELVQITTAYAFRGRGIATALIRYAVWQMRCKGFRKLHAKIWHDNISSIKAFEQAGWKRQARFFCLRFRNRQKPLILTFRRS